MFHAYGHVDGEVWLGEERHAVVGGEVHVVEGVEFCTVVDGHYGLGMGRVGIVFEPVGLVELEVCGNRVEHV